MKRNLITILLVIIAPFVYGQEVMQPETLWHFGRVSDVQVSPDGTQVLFGVTRYDIEDNTGTRDLYVMPVEGGEPRNLTNTNFSESGGVWRPDGQKIGFLRPANGTVQLWEMDPDGNNQQQVSFISGGITGFDYSPEMRSIYFTQRVKMLPMAEDIHPDLPEANVKIADDLMYRHWDRWHDGKYSHIFISPYMDGSIGRYYDIMENEPYDSPIPPFGGSAQISWTPDGQYLAYTCKKKTGKDWTLSTNSDIYLYNIQTRETENLTPFNAGYDRNPVFSPDGRYMAWESMETPGFEADKSRIMIMDLETREYTDYSEGFDQSSSGFTWSDDGNTLYFVSGIHATYQLYALDVASGEINKLTEGKHNYQSVAAAGDYLVGQKMSMSMPTEIFKVEKATKEESQLSFINKTLLDRLELGRVEERWVTTTDDKEMLVWVIYPPNFDPEKKYPALLYCGGGPQSAVSQFFSYRWNFQIMAAHDYIIVAPNRRGLPTFGQEWNDQISEDYGGQNIQDYLSAIDAVKTEPYVDEDRLGAVGASYGGFSVFYLAGMHDNRFSAFISHCGMFNFESWYGSTEEYFFPNHDIGGPYWETPTPVSYQYSPHRMVGNWDTPILIIHGARDYRIPYAESLQAFNTAQLQGIPSRLLFFPDESHWVLQPQNSILWQREFFKWLNEWLK